MALDIVVRMRLVWAVCVGERRAVGGGVHGLGEVAPAAEHEGRHEGATDLRAAEAVNVEVESKVEKLEIVCDGSESLKSEMFIK